MSITENADSSVGSANDSILGAAQVFEEQLEQMTAWKHQLAHQMEVMRRDGIKLLERQKTLAVERKRLADEREQISAEKQHLQMLQEELSGEAKQFKQKNADLDRARGEMKKLEAERSHWVQELAEARAATAELADQRGIIKGHVADAEARIATLAQQLTASEALIERALAAQDVIAEIEALRASQETLRRDLDLRATELAAKERALAEQDARQLTADVQLRASIEQLEIERKSMADLQRTLNSDREALATARQQQANELAERTAAIAAQEERNASLQRELTTRQEDLETAHTQFQTQLAALASDREQLTATQSSHYAEIEAAKNALSDKEAAHVATLAAATDTLASKEAAIFAKLKEEEAKLQAHFAEKSAALMAEVEAAKATVAEKETALAARSAADEATVNERLAALDAAKAELAAKEATLASQKNSDEAELKARLATAEEQARKADEHVRKADEKIKKVEEERQSLAAHRRDLEKKCATLEEELGTQLETLASQTKRLSERRAAIEARSVELENEIEVRTTEMRKELDETRSGYETRVADLEKAAKQAEATLATMSEERAALQQQVQQASDKYGTTDGELARLRAMLAEAQQDAQAQSAQVAAARDTQERMIAEWREKLDAAIAEAEVEAARAAEERASESAAQTAAVAIAEARDQALAEAQANADARIASELVSIKEQLEAAFAERLESELAVRLADQSFAPTEAAVSTVEIEALRTKLSDAEAEKAVFEARLAEFSPSNARLEELSKQANMLEGQRDALAKELFDAQDTLRRQGEDSILARNTLEAEKMDLRSRGSQLDAQKRQLASQTGVIEQQKAALDQARMAFEADRARTPSDGSQDSEAIKFRKERMLRQAKALRHHRRNSQGARKAVEQTQLEVGQLADQLRIRKENLEQVKRLLEKQELVMARKLADHSSMKTVATVGIFVLVVLGIVFSAVYKFVTPTYRTEAVVQLAAPKGLTGARLDSWYADQTDFLKTEDATFAAWRALRTPEQHYAMQDTRDEWIASLKEHLTMAVDPSSHTMAIQYSGPGAEGVSQVCNALATAYTTPTIREGSPQSQTIGAGSSILAKAMPPMYPTGDRRLLIAVSASGMVLVLSAVIALMVRRYVMRQMREIEQMADGTDGDA